MALSCKTPNHYQKPGSIHWQYIIWELMCVTLMLLVANTKWCKNPEKWLEPWQFGTHMRVPSESYSMNTIMTGFRLFSKSFFCFIVLWTKVALELGGLIISYYIGSIQKTHAIWELNSAKVRFGLSHISKCLLHQPAHCRDTQEWEWVPEYNTQGSP